MATEKEYLSRSIILAGTLLYTWVERQYLAHKHNTMSLARARTQTARSGDERTNHEANAPPAAGHVIPDKHFVK